MQDSQQIPWKRITAEGGAIVVSILLAFSIDAWWDNSREREAEKELMRTVLVELQQRQEDRIYSRFYLETIRESCRNLLSLANEPTSNISDQQIDLWLNDTTWVGGTPRFELSVIDALIVGGSISHISDHELRHSMGLLAQLLAREHAANVRERTFIDNQYYPFLSAHGSIGQIFAADDGEPGSAPVSVAGTSDYPLGDEASSVAKMSHREMIATLEFQNQTQQRINLINGILGWGENAAVDDRLVKTISMLEDLLENK